jgi:hypothetical protein
MHHLRTSKIEAVEVSVKSRPLQGLWATGFDATDAISAYPILAFRSSGDSPLWGSTSVPPGFYAWNYIAGGYSVGFQAISNYNRWYTLKFVLTPGVGTSYYIDGVLIGSLADPTTTDLGNVILNVTNFGDEDYDVLWDNFRGSQTCVTVPIFDPTAGFVTGGGWFMSPAGAYLADAGLTGKATFGFVSKYVKGKTLPTGNTQFQFQAGGLTFSSSEYEWLVVNQGGMNAQFKGTGSLNGVPGYRFMVWAKDGTPDTFRIQIEDGGGAVVYDNHQDDSFGTPLGGGSIMIHVPKK